MPLRSFTWLAGALSLALCLDPWSDVSAQQPTGFVLGRVVDAGTGRPIGGAEVRLTGGADEARVLSNADGRFLFRDLAPGTYAFAATAYGYLPGGYGQRTPGGPVQPIILDGGQRVGDMTIRLWREATLSGTVRDDAGVPEVEVSVMLVRREQSGTVVRLTSEQFVVNSVQTDDRGAYWFGGLEPGEYVASVPVRAVQVPANLAAAEQEAREVYSASGAAAFGTGARGIGPVVRAGDVLLQTSNAGTRGGVNQMGGTWPVSLAADGRLIGYSTTFHPAASTARDAVPVTLEAGADVTGIDIVMRPAPLGQVTGRVTAPDGPAAGFAVHIIPAYAAGEWVERTHETSLTTTDADGAFEFRAVPAGEYVVRAWRRRTVLAIGPNPLIDEPTLWGEAPIVVGESADVSADLWLRPGTRLSGRIEIDGSAQPPRRPSVQTTLAVAFEPVWRLASGSPSGVRVDEDWTFRTQGLPPGRYFADLPNRFTASLRDWHFESATHDGADLTIVPLVLEGEDVSGIVIRFSDRQTSIAGVVRDARGAPDAGAAVVVFPADYQTWIDHGLSSLAAWAAPVSTAGSFSLTVRPGRYLVAAIDVEHLPRWRAASTIAALAADTTPITLASGEARQVDLRTRGIR